MQELLRKPEKAGGPEDTISLTSSPSSKQDWPSKREFLYAIMAVDNNKDAKPYDVSYPGPGTQLQCPGKYCGWNQHNIEENKGSFFYVIDDLNHKGSFDKGGVAEWEKQVLFAIAMQVGFYCTSWQRLLICCVRFP